MLENFAIASTSRALEADDHGHEEEHGMSILGLKVLFMVLILVAGLMAFLPLRIARFKPNSPALVYTNCATAGLFLCIAVLHMLPESAEQYHAWAEHENIEKPFPLPYLCVFLGYVSVLFVEKVVVETCVKRISSKNTTVDPSVNHRERKSSETSVYALSAALVLHSFVEGLAAGAQQEFDFALMLSVSILLHKWVAAVAVGIAAVSANLTIKEAMIPIVLFAIATPLGMLIGLAVHAEENLAIIVVNTFSAGTFVYVACTEIVQAEFAKQDVNRWLQIGSVVAGGAIISLLTLFGGHDHSGEGHEGH